MNSGVGVGLKSSAPADRYERLYPDTGIPEAQKQERMERIDFKAEARDGRRTSRNRGVILPRIPWHEESE